MKGWTIVFDLDGTLVDSAPDLADSTNHVLRTLGLDPVDEVDIRPFVGHGALAMIEAAAKSRDCILLEPDLHKLFHVFIAYYSDHIADRSRPYPNVVTTLDALRGEGATLAVCTNKIEVHAEKLLDALDLSSRFAAVTGRDTFDVCKPDAGHFTRTVALAGGESDKAIMIGDSETDIKTAKAAGVPVIAVDFGYSVIPVETFNPDIVISNYSELRDALGRATANGISR